jgi:hypothetical protein
VEFDMTKRAHILSVLALFCLSDVALAADTTGLSTTGAAANTDVSVNPSLDSNVNASSGGNLFDFSNSSRNAPPAPSLPSFAGGPCIGISSGISASGPGFSLGGGRSTEDESCQRRNWVQTLVGVAQHMPEDDANELKRVAIALMMQDEYVGPAFEALGYDTTSGRRAVKQSDAAPRAADRTSERNLVAQAPRQPVLGKMQQGCVTVIPANASITFRTLLEARGCVVEAR